jgi:hypothetical protein
VPPASGQARNTLPAARQPHVCACVVTIRAATGKARKGVRFGDAPPPLSLEWQDKKNKQVQLTDHCTWTINHMPKKKYLKSRYKNRMPSKNDWNQGIKTAWQVKMNEIKE